MKKRVRNSTIGSTTLVKKKKVAPRKDRLGDDINEHVRRLIELNYTLPEQRTSGWFEQRKTRMTASPVSAVLRLSQFEIDLRDNLDVDMKPEKKVGHVMPAFNSYAELMRTKCGVGPVFHGSVQTEWGVTYEPVVTALYELIEDTVVHEFGMIPHPTLDWLGASPDGITSQGRMIEIKCPYSRIPKEKHTEEGLVAVPKMQYWVQMQIQMECCKLDDCDFVDVMIREYGSREQYLNDNYGNEEDDTFIYHRTASGQPKGVVIEKTYYDEQGIQRYEYFYPPVLKFQSKKEEDEWISQWARENLTLSTNQMIDMTLHKLVSYDIRYWRIEKWLVKTVHRNKEWLQQRLPEVHDFWKLVLKYREEGIPEEVLRPSASESSITPRFRSSAIQDSKQQLYIDPVNHCLTTKRSVTASQECLFWDSDEDVNQPIVTDGP